MNVFQISKGIRTIGYNCGVPCWFIDCDLGVNYQPEDLLRKLVSMGLQEKDWVVIRNGLAEKGIGTFVDALGYVHCQSEVEAYGRNQTPAWFTKASRWLVYADGRTIFNFGALRRGQDIVLSDNLDYLVTLDGLVEKGYMSKSLSDEELNVLFAKKIRWYKEENA